MTKDKHTDFQGIKNSPYFSEEWKLATHEADCENLGPYIYQPHVGGIVSVPKGSSKKSGEIEILTFIIDMKAEFATAVNAHDELVGALKEAQGRLIEWNEWDDRVNNPGPIPERIALMAKINSALAKAGVE